MKKIILAAVLSALSAAAMAGDVLVQIGSFRENTYARQLSARAALIGVETTVRPEKQADGSVLYRVCTDKMKQKDAEQQVERLRQNEFEAVVLSR